MTPKASLLVVDDELIVRDSLDKWFREEGYGVTVAESAQEALARMAAKRFDLALVDIKMPGTDGVELQRRMHEIDSDMLVIMMTGYASVETAVAALKNGAYDYVSKPFDPDDISHTVHNALAHKQAQQENARLRETVASVVRPQEIVGQSPSMVRVFEAIQAVGPTDATVLITGESGTGKELCARAIHAASPRHYNPLVVLHCGALAETLLESELFGHEKGAFTGAQYRKKGSFEVADGGTVFLDEVGDITLKTQTDLLRVLQEREITRVGSTHPIHVDFRCIAATNKNLESLVKAGTFRPDLYYRLHVFCIDLPPLRDRREDIPLLVNHFLNKFCMATSRPVPSISNEAMDVLMRHDWPGNVRELENAVERALVVGRGAEIRPNDFSFQFQGDEPKGGKTLDDIERAHIERILRETQHNLSRAARILDIDRTTLYNKLRRYGLR